ncbi:MAG: hypothetical protein MUP52_03815 [Candidatus Aminicenantes bacterium]|nr:hypothetical protein [Candidatus Aminicenantes bacterium]
MKTYPWEKRHPHTFGQRTRNDFIIWSIVVVLAIALGIYAGHKVTAAYKDTEIMDLQAQLETAQASLADANIELAFWTTTLKGLADGGQFDARLSKED